MRSALIIANTEYIDPGLAQLTAPGKDAEDFAQVLRDKDICGFDDVKTLLNEPEHIVRGVIDEFFDQKKPDDLLLLYFSGHGVRDELGSLYLAVKNTIRTRLRSTAIKSDFIREAMDQSRSKRQILILDCCNSGAFAQGTKAATGVSIGTASAFEAGYGRVILTASDSTQFAWEGDKVIGETDNSLFTHYLVEGLEGQADMDGDGNITVDEIYDYVYEKVRLATPRQTPSKFSSKQQGEIILRQMTRIEDIKPVMLPTYIRSALISPDPNIRLGAVRSLAELLDGRNLGLAHSARDALKRVKEDDESPQVSRAALQALEIEEKRLTAEYDYIAQTAIQANNDRGRAAMFYLIAVGLMVMALFGTQFFDTNFFSATVTLIFSGLFILLTMLGISTILKLARLRAQWHEAMMAMNQFKDSMISKNRDLSQTFRWTNSTLPSKYQTDSDSYYQAVEIALVSGVTFGMAIFYLEEAFFRINIVQWILSILAGLLMFFLQLQLYKRSLR